MGFLDKPISELSLAELQRLIRQEVSAQVPAIPAGVLALADLDKPLVPPDSPTNNYTLVYNSASGGYVDSTLLSSSVATDGNAPGSSPSLASGVTGGPNFFALKWTPVTNTDPVIYDVYVSATTGFTPGVTADALTPIVSTAAGSCIVTKLVGGAFAYGTTYFFKIIARDADGSAAAGTQGSGAMVTIQTVDVAALAITTAKIAASAVTTTEILNGTITGTDIASATIAAGNIVANTITAGQIAAGTITTTEIAALTIVAANIAANTITAGKIAANTITASQIAAGTITTTEIAALTITAANIAANTITAAKITAGTITTTEIAALTITGANIAASTITAGKISVSQLSAIAVDAGSISAGTLTGTTVQTAASGQRAYMDPNGLHLVDSSGNTIVDLPTDSTKTSVFTGSLSTGTILSSVSGTPYNLAGTGELVSAGPVTPTNPPNLSVANGGSLVAHDYWVTYSWATANELRDQNQADFEKDATTGINKIVGTEACVLDSTNTVSGYTPNALKVTTAATTGSGVYLGNSVASATVTHDAPVTAGLAYTFSVYLMMTAGGANVKLGIIWKDAAGAAVGSTALTASFAMSTTAMTRQSLPNQTAPAGAVYATMEIITQAATATVFWADQAQFEVAAAASTWAPVQETPTYAPAIKVTTAGANLTVNAVIPASPDAKATKCRIYMSNSATFNAGGGIYQQSATVSTSATTTVALSAAYTSTGMASKTANTWGFWSNGFVLPNSLGATSAYIRPAQYLDSANAQQGWTLEGNGRIRFLGPTMNTQFWLYDEFFYPAAAYGVTGTTVTNWVLTFAGTGATCTASASSSVNPGVTSARSGTTTTGSAMLATQAAFFTGVARLRGSFYFALSSLPTAGAGGNTYNFNVGLSDSGSLLTSAANGIVFRFKADNVAAPVLQLAVSNSANTSLTATDYSGSTITANTYYFCEFEVDAGRSAVNWWVNFVKQTAMSTTNSIPPSTVGMACRLMMQKTATGTGTTNVNLLVDTCSIYGDYVTG